MRWSSLDSCKRVRVCVSRVSCHPAVMEINEEALESSVHAIVTLQTMQKCPQHTPSQNNTKVCSKHFKNNPKMKTVVLIAG